MTPPSGPTLGVVLAGGASSRFGGPKARTLLHGRTLLARAIGVVGLAGLEVGVIANRASDIPGRVRWEGGDRGWLSLPDAIGGARELPLRADVTPGAGPLGGLHTALVWARDRGEAGVFLLGCDMPLVPPGVVRHLTSRFDGTRPVAPASDGPLGCEPLCACYPTNLDGEVTERLAQGERGMGDLLRHVRAILVPSDELASVEGAEHAFANVNTPEDRERVEALLEVRAKAAGRAKGAIE